MPKAGRRQQNNRSTPYGYVAIWWPLLSWLGLLRVDSSRGACLSAAAAATALAAAAAAGRSGDCPARALHIPGSPATADPVPASSFRQRNV